MPSRCGPPLSIRIYRFCARPWSSIPGCAPRASTSMIRDRGYTGSVEQLRRVVARLRPQPREAFLRLQVFPAEQGQVDWAILRIGPGRPGSAPVLLLRDDLVLVAGAVSGVLLRSDHGELPAGPCARLPGLVWGAQGHPVRQPSQCGAGAPRRSDSFQPAAVGTGSPLSLRPTSLPDTRWKSERPRGAGHSFCTRFLLGRPNLHHAGGMQSSGSAMAR